jgi:hypothetical protein
MQAELMPGLKYPTKAQLAGKLDFNDRQALASMHWFK